MGNSQEVKIQIFCQNLPGSQFEERTSVRLGIQKGTVVIEDVAGDRQSASFIVPLTVSTNSKTGKPNFLGPFAQGTPDERFIYLCWGERHNGTWDGFRRAKIHLSHLSYEAIDKAMESGQAIKVVVNMTNDKGGPLCASIKGDKIKWEI